MITHQNPAQSISTSILNFNSIYNKNSLCAPTRLIPIPLIPLTPPSFPLSSFPFTLHTPSL